MKNNHGTISGLTSFALISAILLGATLAVGHVLNIQTAAALGSVTGQATIGVIAQHTGGSDNSGGSGGGGGQNTGGSDNPRQKHSNEGGGGSQYCYSVSITNPLNGKTRTVNVCFDNRSDCEQAQRHDPDSSSGCETR